MHLLYKFSAILYWEGHKNNENQQLELHIYF